MVKKTFVFLTLSWSPELVSFNLGSAALPVAVNLSQKKRMMSLAVTL